MNDPTPYGVDAPFDPIAKQIEQEARRDFTRDVQKIIDEHRERIEERPVDVAMTVLFEGVPEEPGDHYQPGIPAHVIVSDVTILGHTFQAHRLPTMQEWRAFMGTVAKEIERD